MLNKVPLIYTSEKLRGVGLRWKQMINENAKVHAFSNTITEQNYNEIEGFGQQITRYHVLMIQDDEDHNHIKKKMLATKKVLENNGVEVTTLKLKGQSQLSKIFSAIHLGNLTSYELSQLYDTEPKLTPLIEELKKY